MLKYELQFFAKEGEGGEKTEDATPKKLEDARKEGQVAKSQDIGVAAILLIFFVAVRIFGGFLYRTLLETFHFLYEAIPQYAGDFNGARSMNLMTYCGDKPFCWQDPLWRFCWLLWSLSMWHRLNGIRR